MAGLRDNFNVNVETGQVPGIVDDATAAGMGSLRRGWETGRIGNEMNPLNTEALDAEIKGDKGKALSLRARVDELKQKQSKYAPEVGQLEQLDGSVGNFGSYVAAQMGQGAASMVDPMAVSAGLGVVGRIAKAIPHPLAQGLSYAAQGAGLAIPALMSKQQLTGEFIGNAQEDKQLMARTSPQALRDMAGNYGTVAAIPDSFLPGMVGRQISGLSRAGGSVARKAAMGPGLKTLGEMGMEGATEAAQSAGSHQALGMLNPDRDTSGDTMDNWNNFAGGALGSAHFAAAGAYSEAGHNRVGGAAEHLGTKAGEAFDLANDSSIVKSIKETGGKLFGRGKEAATDLMSDEDGKVSATALMENLKAGAQDLKSSAQSKMEERSILNDMPPEGIIEDDAKAAAWFDANAPKRHQLIVDKLSAMGDDPEAQAHLAQATAQHADGEAQGQALDSAAAFILERSPLGRAEARASSLGESLGKLGITAGELLGKGAMAAGKGALSFGKSVLSGAQSGMDKKNMQTEGSGPETFMDWRDRYYNVTGKQAAKQVLAEADPVDTQRAELAGSYVTDVANKMKLRNPGLSMLARNAAFIMSDMAMQANAKGIGDKSARLNRLVDDLHGAFKTETPEILQQLGSIMGPKAAPIIDYMTKELEARTAPGGEKLMMATRDALARQAVGLIDPTSQNALMKQGVNLNTPSGREQLLGLMEDYADGIGNGPGARKALEQHFGAESVANIMTLLNGQDEKEAVGSVVDDRVVTSQENVDPNVDDEETTAFDARAAEKNATKGAGPKVYGFHATANMRTNSESTDMFAPTRAVGEDGVVQRPALFVKGQQLFGGKGDAIEKKIADVKAQLQEDPEYPDHDNHDVRAKSVMEIMKGENMHPAKMLALFRDYMRMAYNSNKLSEEQRTLAAKRGRIANLMIQDGEYAALGDNPGVPKTEEQMKGSGIKTAAKRERKDLKTTPAERREVSSALSHYFTNRFVVVGEQMSNRDPSKMAVTEMLDLNKEGQGLIERARLADTQSGEQTSQALSDANVLMFKSTAVKSGEVAIPAGKLVNWVRKQRGLTEGSSAEDTKGDKSNRSKDDAYLNDVMEGVAALIGSGQVQGMPYKINQFGKPEQFSQGVPSSLRLATMTYGAKQMGVDKRRANQTPKSDEALATVGNEEYDAKVDREQGIEQSDETEGSIDDVVESEGMKRRVVHNALTRAEKVELNTKTTHDERVAYIKSLTKGMGVAEAVEFLKDLELTNANGAAFNPDAKTNKTSDRSKTPMDFFPKAEDGVPDEYANQRWMSVQTGATTDASIGPEPKGTAASSAKYRASQIAETLLNDPTKGQEMIRSRIRSAMRPEYVNAKEVAKLPGKDQVVGGVHYIAPVAALINAESLAKANIDMSASTINAIQSKVANILLKGVVSKTEKVKIARLMLDGTERITAMNVDAVLGRYAGGTVVKSAPVVAKAEPLAAKPDILTSAIAKRQDYLDNPPADYSPEQAKTIAAWATGQLDRVGTEKSTDADRQDQLSDYKSSLKRLIAKAASVGEGDASLSGFEGTSAPEVANASLPKDQATLSGGSEGRKLNAMAVDIHQSLEREGFAATHDSPIKHEGKFDWRAHQGEGEGNASFGAGTYLSTAEGVHKSYKNQFTAQANEGHPGARLGEEWVAGRVKELKQALNDLQNYTGEQRVVSWNKDTGAYNIGADKVVNDGWGPGGSLTDVDKLVAQVASELRELRKPMGKSPTYEVSVDIKPEQLLDWDAPLSKQSELVWEALDSIYTGLEIGTGNIEDLHRGAATGEQLYKLFTRELGSQRAASDALHEAGVLGHKYNASGGRNDVHPNYVIYDDAKITTNYVHFNAQGQDPSGTGRTATQAEMDAAQAEADKLFGKGKVAVLFKDITGYSGEYISATDTVVIATTAAAGTLGTLYHEAMHKFFKDFVKGNPKMIATFESLINDPKHIAKLHALLDGYPAAQAQLHGPGSGEERLSYTYQFWKAGLLKVDAQATTWLQKIGKFFRAVMGKVRDSERALELFQAFDNGKMSEPSAAGRVIAAAMGRGGNAMKFRRQFDGVMQGLAALTVPAAEILGKSLSPTARKLGKMMFTNPGDESHGSEETGMMNARRNASQQYINTTNRMFETMNEIDQNAVQKYLQSESELADIPNPEHRAAVKNVRDVLDRFHKYMTDSGLKIGKVEKYYPTVWSAGALNAKKSEFINMLVTKYADKMDSPNPKKAATRIWESLVAKEGVDAHLPAGREDGVLNPFFASQEMRTLPWLEGADKEKFLEKNMPLTLTRYFTQGVHATEYRSRFGENGYKLNKMLADINVELSGIGKEMMKRGEIKDEDARVKWVSRQMRDVSQSVGAMEGSLGKDVSPNMRKFNSWMAVYQNIRVLPMALFSSFVDPLAMVARGAPLQAAYETFVYSMREVFRGWADAFRDMPPERVKDEWRQLSEHIGASEIAMFQHHVSEEYSSAYMSSGAKKINDKMFVLNGMEAWNRGNRIMATKWAVRFLEKHAGLPDKNHSARWLKELGLTPSMITLDEGKLVTDRHALATLKGISLERATREIAPIHDALNRWVEGAVLTPNAAQRPAWSSDPNYATLFHLKQFSYSFHQTILKRAVNEFKHGNMAPVGALAAFIPTMITADIMKGLIQGGGSLPPYMASMNAGDWFTHGVQRAGLSGIGVIGMDAANDWASLGGPAFEQIVDAARDGFGSKTALHAMPLNSLYGRMISGGAHAAEVAN